MRPARAALQRGLSLFGALVIVALAGVAGYYVYQGTLAEPQNPGCQAQLTSCLRECRRTATDTRAAQACQGACERERAACELPG